MKTSTAKTTTIIDNGYLPGSLKTVFEALVEKAHEIAKAEHDHHIIINVLKDQPRNKDVILFSSFSPPNIINININKHFEQMKDLAELPMRSATLLWFELMRSVGHELYHMLVEYRKFIGAYSNNKEALQIGFKFDCQAAEAWGKELVLALGYETNIDPIDDWGVGIYEDNILSEMLSDWQRDLPNKLDEPWALRQQRMIEENLAWLDDEEEPHITCAHFSDWLAAEGNWDKPLWKVRVDTITKDVEFPPEVEVVQPAETQDAVKVNYNQPPIDVPHESESVEERVRSLCSEGIMDIVTQAGDMIEGVQKDMIDQINKAMEYPPTNPADIEKIKNKAATMITNIKNKEKAETKALLEQEVLLEQKRLNMMTNPAANPTMSEMKTAMYYTFMAIYQTMFEKCGWGAEINGEYKFSMADQIKTPFSVKDIPACELVAVEFGSDPRTWAPIWPTGNIHGMVYVNGTLPAVKLKIRTTKGNLFEYDLIAQNPQKGGAWSDASKTGAKALVIFKKGEAGSTIAARIINGQFIADPLGNATTITAESLN